MREMLAEAMHGFACAGMGYDNRDGITRELVEARRLYADMPDTRSLTGRLMNDPLPQRSALGRSA
jgi:hypothetical protein